ncbi:MAG: hypothetical protein HY363_00745 [Candidatus Aenigmarchaeota archaeon]|nr:hypothetical protein [Candidatus Aenigmarchaeota archaeon]
MSAKTPYVMYRLDCTSLRDKGVGYCVKNAVQAYFSHHGHEATVTKLQANGNNFSMIIKLFDNGVLDCNITALLEHIKNSGRLPTNVNYHPVVSITPIIPKEYAAKLGDSKPETSSARPEFDTYQQTIDSLSENHERERAVHEQRVIDLNTALAQRQKVIDAKVGELKNKTDTLAQLQSKVVSLEQMVKESQKADKADFENPLSAVLKGYLHKGVEVLYEVFADYTSLQDNGDLDFFIALKWQKPEFVEYFAKKSGLKFETDTTLDAWVEYMKCTDSWEKTQEGRLLINEKTKLKTDLTVLTAAISNGASDAVVSAIRTAIGTRTLDEVDSDVIKFQQKFQKEAETYAMIDTIKKQFTIIESVFSNAQNRNALKKVLPVVVAQSTEVKLYVPAFDLQCQLHDYLREKLNEAVPLPEGKYSFSYTRFDENIVELKPAPEINMGEECIKTICKTIKDDSLLRAFGVKPQLIRLLED